MSFIADQIRRVDGQLDRLHLAYVSSTEQTSLHDENTGNSRLTPRFQLEAIVRSLSTTNTPGSVLNRSTLTYLLRDSQLNQKVPKTQGREDDASENDELRWLAVGKATAQTYGVVMNTLLDQIIPFNDDIWYWDSILGSHRYTLLYWMQTSPLRFRDWAEDIYSDVKERFEEIRGGDDIRPFQTFRDQWGQFYGLVKTSIDKRSLSTVRSAVISPMALVEQEIKTKRRDLKKLMEMSASGLGVLMDEGLSFDIDLNSGSSTKALEDGKELKDDWKGVVEKSIALIESVLDKITAEDIGVHEFEDTVFAHIDDDDTEGGILGSEEATSLSRPVVLAKRLQRILDSTMLNHMKVSSQMAKYSGRPSLLIRYWLPATALLLSSTTLLRILLNRKAAIKAWVEDFGKTIVDFWVNWVVEPSKKVIGTIRHDKDSEVAIMSKKSLEGDRASLERMVVDFAKDNGSSGSLSEADISDIRARVQEGDLTTVLVAYERDLRRPFIGTVKGDLVRALLIQIQKTKVDVEVAMGGIDALLKSQELVFGFVGLTPGILVCFAVFRWLGSSFGSRKGSKQGKHQRQMVRSLRNIDRILIAATPSSGGMLSYRDHGLLLCEVHVLRQRAVKVLPKQTQRDFVEDVDDLIDIRTGLERQMKVVGRIIWAYGKWLQ